MLAVFIVAIAVVATFLDEASESKLLPSQKSVTRTPHNDHTQHIDDITVQTNNTPQRPTISDSVFTANTT